jgi:hypothetical protein
VLIYILDRKVNNFSKPDNYNTNIAIYFFEALSDLKSPVPARQSGKSEYFADSVPVGCSVKNVGYYEKNIVLFSNE